MHNGHLLALVVNIPFYTESSSDGNPSLAHWLISTSLVSNSSSLNTSDLGMSISINFADHISYIIFFLNEKSNGPLYDKKLPHSKQSPYSYTFFESKISVSSVHLFCSLDRPEINFVAALSLFSINYA